METIMSVGAIDGLAALAGFGAVVGLALADWMTGGRVLARVLCAVERVLRSVAR